MRIGVPKEIKNNENRVGITPEGVKELVKHGHNIYVQKNAGIGSGISDEDYVSAGAVILDTAEEVWAQEMVMKVKEPLQEEYKYFREDLLLFTYLHLASEPELTKALLESKVTGIAYETVQVDRTLPLLRPMSEVAGRRATIIGATMLEKHRGGRGILLSGVPGTERGVVTILGGGVAGINAAKMAIGLGAKVYILELNEDRIRYLDDIFRNDVTVLKSNTANIEACVKEADVLISTILTVGARASKIVTDQMVQSMKPGAVIIDVSIDQGGSIETIDRITTHDNPTYEKYGVIHYAVANMPGATPRTSTYALTNATIPYAVALANKGYKDACLSDVSLYKGINTLKGNCTYRAVADAFDLDYVEAKNLL